MDGLLEIGCVCWDTACAEGYGYVDGNVAVWIGMGCVDGNEAMSMRIWLC